MQKHRGPILEQQTSILASPRDFSMENAKTSSRTYPLLGRQAAVPPQGDGRSAVAAWKQAFRESRNGMGGRGDFLNLLSFTITWLAVFILSNKPALAVLLVCEPPVMPGVDHGQAGINETSPDRVRRRKPASGKENPLVRSRTGLRERTNEAAMGQIVKTRFSLRARTVPGLAFGCEVACTSVPVWGFEPKSPSLSLVGHVSPR
jgi:hypothetical protein